MDPSTLAKHLENSIEPVARRLSIVTGSRGQDGSYLRDLLGHDKSIGCVNPNSISRGPGLVNELAIDLGNKDSVLELLRNTRPKSIFHLAARHGPSTKMTFEKEDLEEMQRLHVAATKNFLEAIELLGLDTHLVVAGSSRIFSPREKITRISESTPPNPQDFYGASKLAAWELVKEARKEFESQASFLVLFNHESPRRPEGYFSKDLSSAIYEYLTGYRKEVEIQNPDSWGDWSDARDVVRLLAEVPRLTAGDDFVVSSGSLRSVREIIASVLTQLGHSTTPVIKSKTVEKAKEQLFLVGDNAKSVEAGVWTPALSIEQTIVQMVKLKLLGKDQ